ncbi:chromosome replication/partitioning protein [Borrelia crocidurae]|uniref:PF49 plasmid partition protein n=2 Tax=Borrelia crocidurae TaxID=29520 RepID=I0FDV2_BORCA|nr:chromosome replication/partitioning protein [Borrelia crocidurae]AFI31658.1 PF49 plasmid partition protein [Borrelia crocidurae str. Achema]AHH07253.1 Putative plasmid partition protein [Borrelia crocidurae DOU]
MSVVINKRNLETLDEQNNYYQKLKQKLKSHCQQEIYYKMEIIKILKEVKDNEYYKLDNYKTFEDFIRDYKLARSQVYDYLKIANAIENGILQESYVVENGITHTIAFLRSDSRLFKKKLRRDSLKPLKFQLKKHESYNFYKKNVKFAEFLLDTLFLHNKDLLKKFLEEFEFLKG